jgi:predicted transposase/invertase (TIGR01784 family)
LAQTNSKQYLKSKHIYLDILVELEDYSLANIEMQMVGLKFPNTRSAVYSASLISNQYNSLVAKYIEATGSPTETVTDDVIDYSKVHKVYTIVLMESSPQIFHQYPNNYIHRSHQIFDSGLPLDMLQEYIYISLDISKKIITTPSNELESWLAFLTADTVSQIDSIIRLFPYFKNLKDDVILYGEENPREVLNVYLEGIEILDRNTALNEIKENRKVIADLKKENQTQILRVAQNMINCHFSLEQIVQCTGLSEDEIAALR